MANLSKIVKERKKIETKGDQSVKKEMGGCFKNGIKRAL
jgi:hypothetical protein